MYNHIFHSSTMHKYYLLVFLATFAFFSNRSGFTTAAHTSYVILRWSSHGMVLPLIHRRLHSTLQLIIQSYENISFLIVLLNFVIF